MNISIYTYTYNIHYTHKPSFFVSMKFLLGLKFTIALVQGRCDAAMNRQLNQQGSRRVV